jgi:hypothetical protein
MKPTAKKTATLRTAQPAAAETTSRALAPVQQLIADEVADMLVNGGDPHITDLLMSAAAHHQFWRWANARYGPQEQEEIKDSVAKRAHGQFEKLKSDMIVAWRESHRAPKTKPEPKTVTERIRAGVVETLRHRFEVFLTEGTPEEQRLLLDTLVDHESSNHGRDAFGELALGCAFESALGKVEREWLKVPSSMRDQVVQYIACLEVASAKESAS